MPYPQKHPLRSLTDLEERALSQIVKASSERVDRVRRAKALLSVNAGDPFTGAADLSGSPAFHASTALARLTLSTRSLLAVNAGEPFTAAAALSGFKSADSVSQLVERFNRASTRRALHCRRTRAQSHLHQPGATAHSGDPTECPKSRAGSKRHLVA